MIGIYTITVLLLVEGICGCFTAKAATWTFVVSVFLFGVVYQCTLGNVGFALGAEIHSLPLRSTAVSLMVFCQMAGYVTPTSELHDAADIRDSVWVVSVVVPYLISPDAANMGAKIGFIFFGTSLPCLVLMFFFIPETKNLSFEEVSPNPQSLSSLSTNTVQMDYLFATNVPSRRFQHVIKERRQQGVVEVEIKGTVVKTAVTAVDEVENTTV